MKTIFRILLQYNKIQPEWISTSHQECFVSCCSFHFIRPRINVTNLILFPSVSVSSSSNLASKYFLLIRLYFRTKFWLFFCCCSNLSLVYGWKYSVTIHIEKEKKRISICTVYLGSQLFWDSKVKQFNKTQQKISLFQPCACFVVFTFTIHVKYRIVTTWYRIAQTSTKQKADYILPPVLLHLLENLVRSTLKLYVMKSGYKCSFSVPCIRFYPVVIAVLTNWHKNTEKKTNKFFHSLRPKWIRKTLNFDDLQSYIDPLSAELKLKLLLLFYRYIFCVSFQHCLLCVPYLFSNPCYQFEQMMTKALKQFTKWSMCRIPFTCNQFFFLGFCFGLYKICWQAERGRNNVAIKYNDWF